MRKFAPTLLLLCIVIAVNIYFRLGTGFLPFTRQIAKETVLSDIYKESRAQVDEKYKDLPQAARMKLVEQLAQITMRDNKRQVDEKIALKQKEIKATWQDDSGQTFLLEIDPYHWYRITKNLVETGKVGDTLRDRTEYDSYMLSPVGMKVGRTLHKNLHVYLTAGIYKLVKFVNKDLSLVSFVFYFPILISCLAIIMAFFMCFSISSGRINISGFFAALGLGAAPIFLVRSLGGWYDTDPYVILFSILSVWLFYLSFEYTASLRKRICFALLAGMSIGLFSFTWDGWWYIFDLLVISALLYLLNLYLMRLEDSRDSLSIKAPFLSLAAFILSSIVFAAVFCGFGTIRQIIFGPADILFAKGYLQNQFWPNTFLTVDELNKASMMDVINKAGGALVVLCGLIYMLLALLNKKPRDYKRKQVLIFFFTIWTLIMVYVSLKAQRFALLLVVPASISFGLFLERAIDYLTDFTQRFKKINTSYIKAALFIICCLIMLPMLERAYQYRRATAPSIDRDWYELLKQLEAKTPKESIINSWWDFGHWFKATANRGVIFDGATQNTPMAYWMGRVFTTQNEKEAMGILRMLNSGSNRAFEELEKKKINKFKCVEILNEIIVLKESDADRALAKYFPKDADRADILQYTHHPRPAYFIVEPSLLPKIQPISFLGNWDFKRADIYRKAKELKKDQFSGYLVKEYGYDANEALALYGMLALINTDDALEWISHPLQFFNVSRFYRKEGNLLMFDNDFIVDLTSHNSYFSDIRDGKWKVPESLFYQQAGAIKEVKYANKDVDFSVLLAGENDDWRIVIADTPLLNSMLMRLYYLEGAGLKYFKPFIKKDLKDSSDKIIVYKMEWE